MPDTEAQEKSRPKAALNLNPMIVDRVASSTRTSVAAQQGLRFLHSKLHLCRQGLFAVEQRNLLFLLAACPQLVSLFATLPASFASLHTSPHAACAPLLTPLCAGHRGGRCGGLRGRLLGLGI
jgi:hypothetical protein